MAMKGRRDYPEGIRMTQFTDTLSDIQRGRVEPALVFTENQDISLYFDAPSSGFRMTMDGLDVVTLPFGEDIEGETWIRPMGRRREYRTLFEGKDFPLVPGYYVITVTSGTKNWYASIEIRPKFLGRQNWQAMKEELTEEIRNLSFDFMKLHIHVDRALGDELGVDSTMLLRFYIMSDMFPQVLNVLEELSHTANSRITKRFVPVHRGSDLDRRDPFSDRLKSRRPGASRYLACRREMTWDVPENQFAKRLLINLTGSLSSFREELRRSEDRLKEKQKRRNRYREDRSWRMGEQALAQFASYEKRAAHLLGAMHVVSEAPWFRETSLKQKENLSMKVFMDPRYSILYRLYNHLKQPEKSVFISSFYLFQWKRTDKLYELWCFLQFIKALTARGWELTDGPAVIKEDGKYRLDSLEEGTVISLKRGHEMVHLSYDAMLPDSGSGTSRESMPVYTNSSHRRPDFRMDYYDEGLYFGSLIADFKYRDVYYLWKDKEKSRDIRQQFNAYHDMNTRYFRDMSEAASLRNARPVKEVWVVFPRDMSTESDPDYNLRFVSLAPGAEANHRLPDLLEEYISILHQS